MKKILKTLILFLLLGTIFTACNTTKYVQENKYLLKENNIYINGKKTTDVAITDYLIQKPNNKSIGLPIGLLIYNLGNIHYDSIHLKKIEAFKKRNNFWDAFLSKKQTFKALNRKKNINDWFLKKGEAPVVVDLQKTKATAKNLQSHFFNQGYFDAIVNTKVVPDVKKAIVHYNITQNQPYFIGKINYHISSDEVASVIHKNTHTVPLKEGTQYNQDKFKKTAAKFTKTLRNNGFYHFTESLISFREIDTLAKNHITPVDIYIENRKLKKGNKIIELPTKVQTIKEVDVFTDYSYKARNKMPDVKKTYQNINFYAQKKIKHRAKTLANSIFIEPNKIYNDNAIDLTRRHLKSLNNFRAIKINQKELPNNQLKTTIILTPLEKYAISVNTEMIHSNIKRIGLSGGLDIINRNLFKGAEILKLSLQGSIFDTATKVDGSDSNRLDAYEIGIDASLAFPKLIFPVLSKLIPRTMTPRTKATVGISFQENIGLDKQRLTGILNYSWKSSSKNTHSVDLLNLQYIENLNTNSYFTIYNSEFRKIQNIQPLVNPSYSLNINNADDFLSTVPVSFASSDPKAYTTLKNIENRKKIITSNNIIPTLSYSFEHNSKRGFSDTRYNYFKIKASSAGNLSKSLFQNQDIPISQYLKLDIDFRKFWSRSPDNSLAFRTFVGVAIPTGDNSDIPFISSYFAGGSNDIRAWRTYELGPGRSKSGLEFNIGNLKILSNLEYRFKVFNSIHGAVFIDAGNVWNLPNSSTASSKEELFNNLASLQDIAIGSGFGVRYDFNFLVLRLDLAFKTYEPYLTKNKWFDKYQLNQSILNIGINYPF